MKSDTVSAASVNTANTGDASGTITVASRIDPKTFYRFAVFDTLKLRKRWISPAVFAGIFLVCALICFFMRAKTESAALLGTVLLAVGLGVPAVYFGTFFHSLTQQARTMKLQQAAVAYTVTLSDAGVRVTGGKSGGGTVSFRWDQLFGVYQVPGCVYLYVSPRQAFLLPESCVDGTLEELRLFLAARLDSGKIHTR